jgi:NTE family protein
VTDGATFGERFRQFFSSTRDSQVAAGEANGREWDVYDVVSQSFDAMQGMIARQKLAAHPPDVLIDIPRNACGTLEFDRAAEMIELGYQAIGARLAGGQETGSR